MFSTNKEAEGRDIDNEIILRVPLEVKAQLSLVGRSTPEQLDYSIRNRTPGLNAIFDSEIGPIVSHLYQVNFSFIAFSAMTLMIYIYIYSTGDKSRTKCNHRCIVGYNMAKFL